MGPIRMTMQTVLELGNGNPFVGKTRPEPITLPEISIGLFTNDSEGDY